MKGDSARSLSQREKTKTGRNKFETASPVPRPRVCHLFSCLSISSRCLEISPYWKTNKFSKPIRDVRTLSASARWTSVRCLIDSARFDHLGLPSIQLLAVTLVIQVFSILVPVHSKSWFYVFEENYRSRMASSAPRSNAKARVQHSSAPASWRKHPARQRAPILS